MAPETRGWITLAIPMLLVVWGIIRGIRHHRAFKRARDEGLFWFIWWRPPDPPRRP